jgi:hypothetical protein
MRPGSPPLHLFHAGTSLAMIDCHYIHLARGGRDHAIRRLDKFAGTANTPADVHAVDARWTLTTSPAAEAGAVAFEAVASERVAAMQLEARSRRCRGRRSRRDRIRGRHCPGRVIASATQRPPAEDAGRLLRPETSGPLTPQRSAGQRISTTLGGDRPRFPLPTSILLAPGSHLLGARKRASC